MRDEDFHLLDGIYKIQVTNLISSERMRPMKIINVACTTKSNRSTYSIKLPIAVDRNAISAEQ